MTTVQTLLVSAMASDYGQVIVTKKPEIVDKGKEKETKTIEVTPFCPICSRPKHGWKTCRSRCVAQCSVPHSKLTCPERECYRCHEKGHLKSECPNETLGPKCHNCLQRGHVLSRCPTFRLCYLCFEHDHTQRNCPLRCLSCDVLSCHLSTSCVSRCLLCGERGHISKYCTSPYLTHEQGGQGEVQDEQRQQKQQQQQRQQQQRPQDSSLIIAA